jgi:hypothetical protein
LGFTLLPFAVVLVLLAAATNALSVAYMLFSLATVCPALIAAALVVGKPPYTAPLLAPPWPF